MQHSILFRISAELMLAYMQTDTEKIFITRSNSDGRVLQIKLSSEWQQQLATVAVR